MLGLSLIKDAAAQTTRARELWEDLDVFGESQTLTPAVETSCYLQDTSSGFSVLSEPTQIRGSMVWRSRSLILISYAWVWGNNI